MKTLISLCRKLHPTNIQYSGKMCALVAYVLDQCWTNPQIIELIVTNDGFVLAAVEGDCGANDIIGSMDDLRHNFNRLLDFASVAGFLPAPLTKAERQLAVQLFNDRVISFQYS